MVSSLVQREVASCSRRQCYALPRLPLRAWILVVGRAQSWCALEMILQRFRFPGIKEVALFYGLVEKRRCRRERMRRWQLLTCQQRNTGIDMHYFLQRLYAVLRTQAAVMASDVVSCSFPVVACSSRAVGCGVCRHIMDCEVSPFCDMSSNVVARLGGKHLTLCLSTVRRSWSSRVQDPMRSLFF